MQMINNRSVFEFYLITRFIISLFPIIFIGLIILAKAGGINIFQLEFSDYRSYGIYLFLALVFLFSIICELIRPTFVEFDFKSDEIIVKTYSPDLYRKSATFALFGYKKRIREFKISREEYNDYKLTIRKFGMYKELKLQKANDNGVYESPKINISLLSPKKYTNLILAIDRLRIKMSMN